MKRILRLLLLIVTVALLAYGLTYERHEVRSLAPDGPTKRLSAIQFTQGTTTDDYMQKDGSLYDVYSLSPLEASQKDCKT
jgi:hypothetical protein